MKVSMKLPMNQKINEFELTGEVVSIEKTDTTCVISVRVGVNIIRNIISETEQEHLHTGDKVLISLNALNPVIKKI